MRDSKTGKRSFVSRLKVWKKHLDSQVIKHHDDSHARASYKLLFFFILFILLPTSLDSLLVYGVDAG